MGIPEHSGGPWYTGYTSHGPDWFIFCNVGISGRTGHDYDNRFIGDGLVWSAKTSTHLRQRSIQQLLSPTGRVYLFYREEQRDPFTFAGSARPVEVLDTTPVKVRWRFHSIDGRRQQYVLPEEVDDEDATVLEGERRSILVNIYERNPTARRKCITHWKPICQVCEFDFGVVYGNLGDGFIHVHHLKPLGEMMEAYSLIARRQIAIAASLKDDLIAIRTVTAEIRRARTDITNRARAVWIELKQAEADENARVFGDDTARRWVFGALCLATFMVAGLYTSPRTTTAIPSTSVQTRTTTSTPANSGRPGSDTQNVATSKTSAGPPVRLPQEPIVLQQGTPSPPAYSIPEPPKGYAASPPLDPQRDIATVVQPPTDVAGASNAPADSATPAVLIRRLKELGFYRAADVSWSSPALASLREFKIVNHLTVDNQLDAVTVQALLSPQALARSQSFLGAWSTDPVCSQGPQLTISTRDARTEAGSCSFDNFLPNRSGWTVKGHCQVETDKWRATINFTVAGRALSWSSAKGNATYYRCG